MSDGAAVAAILILDTSAILDLVRAPVRREFHVTHAAHARAILAAARQANPQVRLIISDVVEAEFARNLQNVLEDTKTRFVKCCEEYRHALAIVAAFSDVPAMPSTDAEWVAENIRHGERMAAEVVDAAAQEVATDEDQLLATQRVWRRIAPAETGNNNLADCVITQVALRLARARGAVADRPKLVLFSSNTEDFCIARSLKPSLQVEFDVVGLQFVKNWAEAWAATVRGI